MSIDFRSCKKLSIGGIELKQLFINGINIWNAFTNMIAESITSSKTPYVGNNGEDGYKTGYYINSAAAEQAYNGVCCTGFIPVNKGDILYLKNIKVSRVEGLTYQHQTAICLYNSSFTKVSWIKFIQISSGHAYLLDSFTADANNYVTSFRINDKYNDFTRNGGYIRICAEGIDSNSIITINEPI